MRRVVLMFLSALAVLPAVMFLPVVARGADPAANPAADAKAYLVSAIADPEKANIVMVALRATGDKELTPLLTAMAKSSDERHRRFALAALGETAKKDAAGVMVERLRNDDAVSVRAEAIIQLVNMDAASADQLAEALKVPDEGIQLLACRAIVKQGNPTAALDTLRKLAKSSDQLTAGSAQLSLLALGFKEYAQTLGQTFADKNASVMLLAVLMAQVSEQKITQALDLANTVLATQKDVPLRVAAYKAIGELSADGSETLGTAIQGETNTIFRVNLLKVLAGRSDSAAALKQLAAGEGMISWLSKFELARPAGGDAAAQAALKAMAEGHPVVVDYLLDAAKTDIAAKGDKTAFYIPVLLAVIKACPEDSTSMTAEHFRAAQAASLLLDIGTAEALAGVKDIISQRYSNRVRAAAAGLLRTKNKAACEIARPLLQSPYDELVSDAALVLGKNGDSAANDYFATVLAKAKSRPAPLVAMACWYLLKTDGLLQPAVAEMVKQVK